MKNMLSIRVEYILPCMAMAFVGAVAMGLF